MSFYIQTIGGQTVEWHIGEKLPHKYLQPLIRTIFSVQVDGDELCWVLDNFIYLPQPRKDLCRVMTWHGDIAKMIVSSLPVSFL